MRTSSSKKKAKKKKKPSPPAAASAPAPQPAEAAGSPAPETLALASLAASETESSSSCEAATCTSSVSSFTASSSGPASTSSFSAFSSSASTASSSAAGEERRDLAWLLDAFASATIDQVDSAYREAGGDPFLAAGILGSSQDTMPPQPAPQPPPPPDLSPRSGSGGRKAGRRQKKAAVAATGMVADVIGKDYTRPATPLVSAPNVWKGKDGAGGARKYSVEEDGTRKYSVEEAEQFMCSMLGDSSELGMGVVRDVLGQYGYDVEKALDALLDISGVSSTQNMEANHTSAGRNGTCHPNMFPGNVLSVENLTEGNTRCARQLTDEVSNTRVQSELGHEFLCGEPQIRWSMREMLLKIFMGILFFKGPFLLLYFLNLYQIYFLSDLLLPASILDAIALHGDCIGDCNSYRVSRCGQGSLGHATLRWFIPVCTDAPLGCHNHYLSILHYSQLQPWLFCSNIKTPVFLPPPNKNETLVHCRFSICCHFCVLAVVVTSN